MGIRIGQGFLPRFMRIEGENVGNGYIRIVDFVFFHEAAIREAILDARNDVGSVGRNGSGVGDPTATQAIRNTSPIRFVNIHGTRVERPESWIRVIESTRAWFSLDHDRHIVLHDLYAGVDYRKTCAVLSISKSALYGMRNDIRQHAALCAANLNLIKFI